jgi:secretion/DNA translocation related CpaE-like protein
VEVAVPDRPLLVTGEPQVLDDLLRLAAAAGVDVQVAPDVAAARPLWGGAPIVLVGADIAEPLSHSALPRRPGVLLVLSPADDEAVAFAVAPAAGVESVLALPRAEQLLVQRLAVATRPGPTGRAIGVVSGRGGAGASTLAVALARTAASGPEARPTMLVDGDPLGGGLDLALGAEDIPGLRWPDLAATRGSASPGELRAALPCVDGVTLLSWHRGPPVALSVAAVEAVLLAARRGHSLVVVDLPGHPDPAAWAALRAVDIALVVVPADVRSAAAGAAVATRLIEVTSDVRVVVRGPAPSGLTATQVADFLGLPLAGWLDPEPGLPLALERGDPPPRSGRGPLARLCRVLLDDLDSVPQRAA